MIDKLNYYDILGNLVPGSLLVAWLPICFPSIAEPASTIGFSDAFGFVVLTALAIFAGHVIHALSSLMEPFLHWTWGGRPSDRAMPQGLGDYLPHDSSLRIKRKLSHATGGDPSDRSLFLFATRLAYTAQQSRLTCFNSLYGFSRNLLVLVIVSCLLLVGSMVWASAASLSTSERTFALVLAVPLLLLMWYRAKQRALYYVREVLITAESVLDERVVKGRE